MTRFTAFRILVSLGLISWMGGCRPTAEPSAGETPQPVTGQVFVIAPSGETVRLGAVRVQVFDQASAEAHVRERKREVLAQQRELNARLAKLEMAARREEEAFARAEKAYNEREAEIRQELEAITDRVKQQVDFLQAQIRSNEAIIERNSHFPSPPPGIPSKQEFQAYDEIRRKWISMGHAERGAWVTVLTALNRDLRADMERLVQEREEKVFAFADELQPLDEQVIAAGEALAASRKHVEAVRSEIDGLLPDHAYYLAEMPSPIGETWTDAAGEFSLDLPRNRSYAILVQAERQFGGEPVAYQWLVRLGGNESSRILLSNHNLIASEASENVVHLTAAAGESNT